MLHKTSPSPTHHSSTEDTAAAQAEEAPAIGGLFQLAKKQQLSSYHMEDSSLLLASAAISRDWSAQPSATVKSLFVTGNWGAESAQAQLDEDDALYGDFEDLETGGKGEGQEGDEGKAVGGGQEEDEKSRMEKKKKLKEAFNAGYDDDEEEGGGYLEDLKRAVSEQEQRNKAEFEGMDDRARLQLEGIRPGHYVRIELKG